MNKERSFSEFAKIIPELLENNETITISPQGSSMTPTIRQGDTVVLQKPCKIKKYDIVLFTKKDGKAILHRVVKKLPFGEYVMQGDSQSVKELGITDKDIIARVIKIKKGKKTIITSGFWFYISSFILLHLKYIKRMFV